MRLLQHLLRVAQLLVRHHLAGHKSYFTRAEALLQIMNHFSCVVSILILRSQRYLTDVESVTLPANMWARVSADKLLLLLT